MSCIKGQAVFRILLSWGNEREKRNFEVVIPGGFLALFIEITSWIVRVYIN